MILAAISFIPPLIFSLFYPQGFSFILSFAGIFVSLLLGIIPALMVWRGKYVLGEQRVLPFISSRWVICITIAFFLFVIGVECFNQWEFFTKLRT